MVHHQHQHTEGVVAPGRRTMMVPSVTFRGLESDGNGGSSKETPSLRRPPLERRSLSMGRRMMMVPSVSSRGLESDDNGGSSKERPPLLRHSSFVPRGKKEPPVLCRRSLFSSGVGVSFRELVDAVGDEMSAFVSSKDSPLLRQQSLRQRSSATGILLSAFSIAATNLSYPAPLAEDDLLSRGEKQQQRQKLRRGSVFLRPDELNLFEIPEELCPTYWPMPMKLQLAIVVASALFVSRSSLDQLFNSSSSLSIQQCLLVEHLLTSTVVLEALFFILRTAIVVTIVKLSIQETFYMPSGVTAAYLAERGELPSRLSKYADVKPVVVSAPSYTSDAKDDEQVPFSVSPWKEEDSTIPIGVHSIQYTQQKTNNNNNSKHKYDGMYLYHGFGANSLTWLPVLPSLVDRLGSGSSRGVAHDAPGFGFTDRPSADEGGLEQYEYENNVGIGLALLNESLSEQDASNNEISLVREVSWKDEVCSDEVTGVDEAKEQNDSKSIAIFGHSMGSKSALLTALHYAFHPELQLKPKLVVLVGPALEGLTMPSRRGYGLKKLSNAKESDGLARKLARFRDHVIGYFLRRIVCGTKEFWRKALTLLVWGKCPPSDSDVLRFQWASVAKGWEGGIINFIRARILSSKSQYALDDGHLLQEVANLEGTQVVIIYGSRDKVVPIEGSVAQTLERGFPNVKVVRMEGLGHDPHEEDVDGFLLELEKALE